MSRFLKIIKYIGVALIMSIPYLVLMDYNRNATPVEVLHLDGTFRFFSVIFGIQFLLSMIGTFFIFGKLGAASDDHNLSSTAKNILSFAVMFLVVFTVASAMVFYQIVDTGDRWTSGSREVFSRLMHPNWKSSSFYLCMTISLIQIELGIAGLVHTIDEELWG